MESSLFLYWRLQQDDFEIERLQYVQCILTLVWSNKKSRLKTLQTNKTCVSFHDISTDISETKTPLAMLEVQVPIPKSP